MLSNPALSASPQDLWAQCSGQLMIEEGFIDYRLAKNKAAKQLGIPSACPEPSIAMIESQALAYYRETRQTADIRWHIDQLHFAKDSLQQLAAYQPKLAGTLIKHRPNAHDEIELHCHLDTAEHLLDELYGRELPLSIHDKRLRFSNNEQHTLPSYVIPVGEFYACLVVITEQFHGLQVLSAVTTKPLRYWGQSDISTEIDQLNALIG